MDIKQCAKQQKRLKTQTQHEKNAKSTSQGDNAHILVLPRLSQSGILHSSSQSPSGTFGRILGRGHGRPEVGYSRV